MKRKITIILLCAALTALISWATREIYLKLHADKDPEVISDLCYGKSGQNDCLVYVKENGEYTPYIVIDTKNYGDDAVLLLRKNVYMQEMMYRDANVFGTGGAYYSGSIVDEFLESEFYGMFSEGMKKVIRNSPVRIHTRKFVEKRMEEGKPYLETIYRHVFVLSAAELNGPLTRNADEDEGDVIPEALECPVLLYTWLRSEAIGGDDTHASLWFNTSVVGNHIQNGAEHYVRPVITVNRNEPIELRQIETEEINREVYVFVSDQ
jgi:hypothetical protein